ncbi:hypothetical protein HN789_06660 [archaeon]|jgi:hypothetical protein|nr:hypothetical protein [archaeon]MBT4022754.1 hypothetical protein [archaeon]MBT4273052.1 hypothetical protein [archaeon]MBT4461033.1 hypothetical protein [archaeon]MBT4858073.1 hypothetical protein [archaeon]
MKYVLFFSECGEQDSSVIGRKGVNLALLFKKGFKVPPGFILSSNVFDIIKDDKRIKSAINNLFSGKKDSSSDLQKLLRAYEFSEEIEDEITEAYLSLSVDLNMTASSLLETKEVFVAVRSSAIDPKNYYKDLAHKTILNSKGKKRILKIILEIYYHMIIQVSKKHMDIGGVDELSLAIIVQKMVNSKKSGIACSVDEENGQKNLIIKACFGLGEGMSSGSVFPDVYQVDKKSLTIDNMEIAEKQFEFVRDIETNETIRQRLGEKSHKQVLNDNEIIEIARIVKKIVHSLEKEVKIEWAIRGEVVYILQLKDVNYNQKETVEMEILPQKEDDVTPEIIDVEEADLDDDLQMLDEIEKYEKQEEYVEIQEKESVEEEVIPISLDESPEIKGEVIEEDESPEYNIFPMTEEVEEKDDAVKVSAEDLIQVPKEEVIQSNIEPEIYDSNEVMFDKSEEEKIEEEIGEESKDEEVKEESIFGNFDTFQVEDEPKESLVQAPETSTEQPVNKYVELAKLNAANTLVFCHMALKDKLRQKLSRHTSNIPEEFLEIIDGIREFESVQNEEELRSLDQARNEFIFEKKYPSAELIALALKLV